MNAENTALLIQAGPTLFRTEGRDPRSPFALFHFECGDGWFQLLYDLITKLEVHARAMLVEPHVEQVKQKYGTLRFYISHGTEMMYALIHEAEDCSAAICENCGAPGRTRGKHWLGTTCDRCAR